MARILVVDDNKEMREVLRIYIEKMGHTVQEAANGLDALQECERSEADLVVCDIGMPVMDGGTFLREFRDARPGVPVVMLTSRHQDSRSEWIGQGADAFFEKPIMYAQFKLLIDDLVSRGGQAAPQR